MAFQRGPHVRDIFIGREEKKENKSKSKYKNIKQGANRPVKLGEYKPRILSEDETINVPIPRLAPNSQQSANIPKPYVVGDKDTPLVLLPLMTDDDDFDFSNSNIVSSNPVFNKREAVKLEQSSEIINGLVIPPPDYEEDLYAEIRERVDFSRPIHRNYGGDDYSRYLKDDDAEDSNRGGNTVRSEKPVQRNPVAGFDKKSKTEAKRANRYQKKDSKVKSIFRNAEQSKAKNTQNRNSLRDFSFADSKFAETNEGIKRQISGGCQGAEEAETFLNTSSKSYESFLCARHGSISETPNEQIHGGYPEYPSYETENNWTTSSGSPPSHKGDSKWKRFTWRFKKQSSYIMAYD